MIHVIILLNFISYLARGDYLNVFVVQLRSVYDFKKSLYLLCKFENLSQFFCFKRGSENYYH